MAKNNTKNFIWNAIGLTLNSFNSLFFLISVRYINGMDIAGIFTYAFALCALFYVISFYFNRSFQISDSQNHFSFNDYLSCRVFLSLLSLILLTIFSFINGFSLYEISIILSLMLFRLTESISDCFYGAIHKKSHLYQTGISLSLKAIIGLAAFIITDFLTHDLLLAITALTIINVLIFFLYDSKNYHKLYSEKIKLNFKNLKLILKTCFPVFLFSILSLYLANCQKYIMPYFESNEAQTIFGILIMPATILGLVGSYLINPFLGAFTRHFEQKNFSDLVNLIRKILCAVIIIGASVTTIFYFLGTYLLGFIYHLDLSPYQIPLTLIIIASVLFAIALIISNLLTVLKENKRQTHIYIITSIITTIVSVLFISSSGIPGAAYSFLTSSIILTALYVALLQTRIHNLRKDINHEQ